MQIQNSTHISETYRHLQPAAAPPELQAEGEAERDDGRLREVFDQFVGQTFFQQMLSAMRKTVDKPAYFHGGRAEEVFQGQLDQLLSEQVAEASEPTFIDPMYDLFMLARR